MKQGDLIQERYRLDSQLGTGGMAEVWRALDERLNRPVAIKLMAPHLADNPDFLVRFFTEAQCVARISDPAVVKVLDFGQQDDLPYLVMELVPGGSLDLPEGEKLLPERALELVAQAASGAGAAHAAGLVHRDIKPANILLDAQGNAKLADFGIASSRGGERMTGTGAAIGSPHYISPEQVSGLDATPASDVYALGVVLYELLTGRKPFEGGNPTMIAISHIDKMPDPPSTHTPSLDPGIDTVVMRCLEKDPEDRFPDGHALAEVLEKAEFGGLALAAAVEHEPGEGEGDPSQVRSRRLLAGAITAALLLGLTAWGLAAAMKDGPNPSDVVAEDPAGRSGSDRPGASPSPTATASPGFLDDDLVAATPSPSPTARGGRGTAGGRDPRDPDNDATSGDGTDPQPEPTYTDPAEPSPSPTAAEPTPSSEPSQEPSPEPSPTVDSSPAPDPAPSP